jgi:hypothetical protein
MSADVQSMAFSAFLMAIGMVGTAFLSGVIVRSFWSRERVPGAGLWFSAMLFMGLVSAIASASNPVIEPLWLQYALLLVAPFVFGFVCLLLLTRGRRANGDQ